MRVAFYLADQNPHRDRTLGITSYTAGLLSALARSNKVDLWSLRSLSSVTSRHGAEHVLQMRTDRAASRLWADHFHRCFQRPTVDLWHYPKGFLPMAWRDKTPSIITVHDTILQYYSDHYPSTRSEAAFAYWLRLVRHSMAKADGILTVSEFSLRCINDFTERHRIKLPPISVTYQGCRFEAVPQPVAPQKQDVVLHFASTLPHKQTAKLVALWRELPRGTRKSLQLRLIGEVAPDVAASVSMDRSIVRSPRLGQVELEQEIQAARAVIVPSEIEGFGLPALEGYYLGTPVIFVRDTAIEEVLGYCSVGGFHLHDAKSYAESLEAVLALTPEEVYNIGISLRHVYSWQSCAQRTLDAYRSLP